jgi:hypothetical protein
MKGHITKSCYAKKNKTPKKSSITRVVAQLIKLIWVLIKYSCLFYNQMDHEYVDCPKRFEVQVIL